MIKRAGVKKHRVSFFGVTPRYRRNQPKKASNGSLTIACSAQFKIIACRIYHCNPKVKLMLPVV